MAIDQDEFKAIISGRRADATARGARSLLRVASLGYGLAARVRNGLYDRHLLRSHRANAVVLCVGNLTTGGTGKTPLVAWVCRHVRERQLPCAMLTRGYKTQRGQLSDEPALLATQCPDVPVVVNPDRAAGAAEAVRIHGARVLVMDDGFQHRRLARDVDIVTIDATLPFGYGRLLPAGLLRERVAGLRRAGAVVITRCDQVSEENLAQIEGQVRRLSPDAIIARSIHAPVSAVTCAGAEIGLDQLRGKRVYAFCGLGNPEAFFDTVRRIGCVPAGYRSFDDHHAYTREGLSEIRRQAKEHSVNYILTTQKDWTKIARLLPPENDPPMAYLAIEVEFLSGSEQLTALIDRVLDGKMAQLPRSEQ
jgi:tetraacyldisaccharide 4'-kinase